MVKVFLKKTWGFSPEDYPALGFGKHASLRTFLHESSPNDWVVIAGTLGDETAPEHRGRLLGMVRLSRSEVPLLELLREIGTPLDDKGFVNGEYKWPYGLVITEAYWFDGLPKTADVFGSNLVGRHWATYAQDVDEFIEAGASEKVLSLPKTKAKLCDAPTIKKHLVINSSLASGKTGPGPSSQRSGSNVAHEKGYTYLLQLQGGDNPNKIFKVGYSSAPEDRIADLNKGLLTEFTGCRWEFIRMQPFDNPDHAYKLEQELHRLLASYRSESNIEVYVIDENTICSVWNNAFADGAWV